VLLSQVFAHHENLGYAQYGTLPLAEMDGVGNVESEAVEGDYGVGGEGLRGFGPNRTGWRWSRRVW